MAKRKVISDHEIYDLLLKKEYEVEEFLAKLNITKETLNIHLQSLKKFNFNIKLQDGILSLIKILPINYKHGFNIDMWKGDKLRFGVVSDNHLCNVNERLDVLNALYDIFASEGIDTIYNAGNWIDGEARFNKNELHTHGLTNQINYAVKHYPYRKGITTQFISGDDHEGWYNQREGINIGDYFQSMREQAGMFDLKHLGYMEADIELSGDGFKNHSWMRIIHPGGGSAYALSYQPQKIVESYQGGEKPSILIIGHYHKIDYSFPREVHCVQPGCTEDQSLFMRKRRIQAMLGGTICEVNRASDGTINRFKPDFITFYDKKFYIGKDKYFKQ